jgi:hypothetical protein
MGTLVLRHDLKGRGFDDREKGTRAVFYTVDDASNAEDFDRRHGGCCRWLLAAVLFDSSNARTITLLQARRKTHHDMLTALVSRPKSTSRRVLDYTLQFN